MYYISSIIDYKSFDPKELEFFLDDMISKKILKSFYVVKHFDLDSGNLHFHFYFEFYNKKVFYENYGLFSSYGFIDFLRCFFYTWLSNVDTGMHFFDKNSDFSFDYFFVKP